MSEKKAKNYIKGSVREPEFSRGRGDILNVDVFVPELEEFANEKGFAKITIYRRREIDEYGNTHYMFENEFVPDKSKAAAKKEATNKAASSPAQDTDDSDSMPWD